MTLSFQDLHNLLLEIAALMDKNEDADPQLYTSFLQYPELALPLVDYINDLEEEDSPEANASLYSTCIIALEICVAQMQSAADAKNKIGAKSLQLLMNALAKAIHSQKHSLSFWLPALNAFYEVNAELSPELKDAYLELASYEEEPYTEENASSHLNSIKDLIHDLEGLSVFDIAENFFAQSYAMPAEFFSDLMMDLFNIEEGQDIALLILLHPKADVREIAVNTLDLIMENLTLSSISLSRLQIIKYWFGASYHATFDKWIKIQRIKGVIFAHENSSPEAQIKATEVDGSGSQGIFLRVCKNRKYRLCGLLVNAQTGIKDAWITPILPAREVKEYYKQAFTKNVTLREVDFEYFEFLVTHFLAVTVEQGNIPYLHFLEIQELLGLRLRPQKLDVDHLFEQLSIQITPFTKQVLDDSLQRSKSWLKNKAFTESWFIENSLVDKIVNHNSTYVEGIKVCNMAKAMSEVFEEEMESNRDKWQFHFLWMALWSKVRTKKNEKIWQDNFLIAYAIKDGIPLKSIPVMQEICRQTVINSVETMQERRTHLS